MWPFSRRSSADPAYEVLCDEEQLSKTDDFSTKPGKRRSWPFRWTQTACALLIADLIILGTLVLFISPLIILLVRNEALFGHRAQIQSTKLQTDTNAQSPRHNISRILHQTAKTDIIPEKWAKSQQSCKEAYSDFEYKFWTDESAREFLLKEYSWFMETWDNYAIPIQRADAIRYFILYHYGGIYLDMDMVCNTSFPVQEFDSYTDTAVLIATKPTGVTNDFMLSTAKHPAFEVAIRKLPVLFRITRFWAHLQPYANIMLSTGPLFLSLAMMDYLLRQPSLPSPTLRVLDKSALAPYITDLQTATWHGDDARVLKWMGDRPWIWFFLGLLGLTLGLWLVNRLLLLVYRVLRSLLKWTVAKTCGPKQTKLS